MNSRASMRPPPEREYLSTSLPFHSSPPESTSTSVPAPSSAAERPHGSSHELAEKYSHLKRRYFDMEGKLKESRSELERSMERNSRLRFERSQLLDRIIELEDRNKLFESHLERTDPAFLEHHRANAYSTSGAFPTTFVTQRSRAAFMANLQRARDELDNEDPSGEPSLTPHHVSPMARKRPSEELERRQDDDIRELKRSRSSRSIASSVAASAPPPPSSVEVIEARESTGSEMNSGTAAMPVTDVPQFARTNSNSGSGLPSPIPALPSSKGTRLRIKPARSGISDPPFSSSTSSPPRKYLLPREEGYTPESSLTPLEQNDAPGTWYSQDYPRHPPHLQSAPKPSPPLPLPAQASPHHRPARPQSPRSQPVSASAATQPPPPASSLPAPATLTMSTPRPSELQRQTKPKRLKAHTVTSKSYSIPTVPRDRQTGRPLLPLTVGIMTVVKLGEVCLREHFHTERYIFPIGYEVTRRYLSTQDANAEVVYYCTILDGGDAPKFQIIAADMPDKPIIAGTATGAWSGIVRAANLIRKRQHSNSVSGPDYFGLGQNTIKHLIQELPCANQLKNYVWQNFVEGGPLGGRHAAVVPALPEEYDTLPPLHNTYALNSSDHDRDREREKEREHGLVPRHGEPATGSSLSAIPGPSLGVASGMASQVNSTANASAASEPSSATSSTSNHDLVSASRSSESYKGCDHSSALATVASPSLHDRMVYRSQRHTPSPTGTESELGSGPTRQLSTSPTTYFAPHGGPGSSSSSVPGSAAKSTPPEEYSKSPSPPGTVRPTLASIMHSYPSQEHVHRNGHSYANNHGHHGHVHGGSRTPFKSEGTLARA